jgi:hypothetical protein
MICNDDGHGHGICSCLDAGTATDGQVADTATNTSQDR